MYDNIDEPALGWLIDGDPDTSKIPAFLELSDGQLLLHILMDGLSRDDPRSRWFMGGGFFGDDPEKLKFEYSPPKSVGHESANGLAVLQGCRFVRGRNVFGGVHVGTLLAHSAVLGAHGLEWDQINHFRSVIPELRTFSGLSTVSHTSYFKAEKSRILAETKAIEVEPITVARDPVLVIVPKARTSISAEKGELSTVDEVALESKSEELVPLADHYRLHEYVRHLVQVAVGGEVGYRRLMVTRADEPSTLWLRYLRSDAPGETSERSRSELLFTLSDLGKDAIQDWIHMRSEFGSGLDSAVWLLSTPSNLVDVDLVVCGITIEALGYGIRKRKDPKKAKTGFEAYARAVLSDIGFNPFADNYRKWPHDLFECYGALKHPDWADNPNKSGRPDVDRMVDTILRTRIVLRTWIATRLGCSEQHLLRQWKFQGVYSGLTATPD